MTWANMWGGDAPAPAKSRIVLQCDDEKPMPRTSRRRRNLPEDRAKIIDDRRRALLRYLAGGRVETCKEISAALGFDAGHTISVLARASVLIRVAGVRAKWRLL